MDVWERVDRNTFFERVEKELGIGDVERLHWAYSLSKYYHRNQVRDDGQRYFEHCRAVAMILMDIGPTSFDELIEAFLHDAYEDQFVPAGMLRQLFGREIDEDLKLLSQETIIYRARGSVEKIRREKQEYFDTIAQGSLRVRRVKLADRLHNLRTIGVQSRKRIGRKVEETHIHLFPIASSVGGRFFLEMVTACEKALNPFESS